MDVGAHRLIPLFFFGSPDSRLRSLLVAWKKSLALDYGYLVTLRVPLALPHLVCRSSLGLEVVSLFFNCRERCSAVDTNFQMCLICRGLMILKP
jgi:hypothetical protein